MHHINLFVCFYWSDSADWRERKTFFESLSFTVINATEIVCVSPCKSVTFEQKVMSQHSPEYFSVCWMCRRLRGLNHSAQRQTFDDLFFFLSAQECLLKAFGYTWCLYNRATLWRRRVGRRLPRQCSVWQGCCSDQTSWTKWSSTEEERPAKRPL